MGVSGVAGPVDRRRAVRGARAAGTRRTIPDDRARGGNGDTTRAYHRARTGHCSRRAAAPQTEVITVAPSSRHVWVPGYWTWRDDDWVWRSGYWESRPYPDALWVPGQWVATANGWRWQDGRWR
ncbi:MAG: YXWGXW repeat-containing protein [Candidatus Competibacteraceae bacterium]|nr:YXWGXW repeat-containing protein [Candidatus Competibacteraceae bacterium]